MSHTNAFPKYPNSPVYVWPWRGRLRMDVSWRPRKALAVTFFDDGIHWDEPLITLSHDPSTGWEDDINRNCILPDPSGGYFM